MPSALYRPDMPEIVGNARVLLWIQVALNACVGVIQMPFFFPAPSTKTAPEVKAVLAAAGVATYAVLALTILCAVLLTRGIKWVYVVTLLLQLLTLASGLLAFSWMSLPSLAMSLAVVWILVLPKSRTWFFPPKQAPVTA